MRRNRPIAGWWLWVVLGAASAQAQEPDAAIDRRVDAGHDAGVGTYPTVPVLVAPPPTVSAAPVPTTETVPVETKHFVTLNDSPVFALRVGRGDKSAAERVATATRALEVAAEDASEASVRSAPGEQATVIYVGDTPIVQLTEDDARAAADTSLEVHTAAVLAAVRDAVGREAQRRDIANTAFSVSLMVLLGLITVYVLRRFHALADRWATQLMLPRSEAPSVRMSSIEVIAPGTLRSMLLVALSVARWLGSIGVVYAWLIVALSWFEATRDYTERLTGYVVNPLAELMGRFAQSVPTFVVAFVAALAVALLVRFVGLFFASVARGEASLSWVSPDLAVALSVPVQVAIVVSALVFAAPIVVGDHGGTLSLLGGLVVITVAMAAVPWLANALIGLLNVLRRRVRVGERAELGGIRGRVIGLDLWSVRMEDASGAEVHVPHWLVLMRPMRLFPLLRRATIEVAVAENIASSLVLSCLSRAAGEGFDQTVVTVVRVSDGFVTYRLTARSSMPHPEATLLTRVRPAAEADAIVIARAHGVDELA